jgi:ADP-L-glycero-D-manno-heptose 6-epimerase
MRIFITGASGFIGSNLCKYLKNEGHEIYPLCTQTCEISDMFPETSVFQSVFGFDTKILKKVDGIIHLAANNDTVSKQSGEMLRSNFYTSKKLLSLSKRYNHSFFVYASSTAVYGKTSELITEQTKTRSKTIYSKSKLKFDKFITKLNPRIHWVGLRLCNVYGPNENNKTRRSSYVNQILNKMIKNQKVELFENGEQIRDWCYVEDVCHAFSNAISSKKSGIYNIGSGNSISFNDLFNICSNITGYNQQPVYIENKFKSNYQESIKLDIILPYTELNYNPKYSLESGIEKLYLYLKNS